MNRENNRCIKRKHPAHHPVIEWYNAQTIVFLTVCTHQRKRILDCGRVHVALIAAWSQSTHWLVGRYVIMPDHIHLFCTPASCESVGVAQWTAYWKRLTSQRLSDLQPRWQRDCWDTQLRRHESYSEQWNYVRNNPVRAGLVDDAEAWSYQGILNHLPW